MSHRDGRASRTSATDNRSNDSNADDYENEHERAKQRNRDDAHRRAGDPWPYVRIVPRFERAAFLWIECLTAFWTALFRQLGERIIARLATHGMLSLSQRGSPQPNHRFLKTAGTKPAGVGAWVCAAVPGVQRPRGASSSGRFLVRSATRSPFRR